MISKPNRSAKFDPKGRKRRPMATSGKSLFIIPQVWEKRAEKLSRQRKGSERNVVSESNHVMSVMSLIS